MKKTFSSRHGFLNTKFMEWILGSGLAFLNIYFLDYVFRLIYPSEIDDMGHAIIQQMQSKLALIGILVIAIATVTDIVGSFSNKVSENKNDVGDNFRYVDLLFPVNWINDNIPGGIIFVLILMQKTLILSMMAYVTRSSFATLKGSMDFLLSGPLPIILFAYMLLITNCVLVFCLLLFSAQSSYKWSKWVSNKVLPNAGNEKYYFKTPFLISFLLRCLCVASVIIAIGVLVTFKGNFTVLIGLITKISLVLGSWVGIIFLVTLLLRKKTKVLSP